MGVSPMSRTVVPTVQTHRQALGAPKGMAVVLTGKPWGPPRGCPCYRDFPKT